MKNSTPVKVQDIPGLLILREIVTELVAKKECHAVEIDLMRSLAKCVVNHLSNPPQDGKVKPRIPLRETDLRAMGIFPTFVPSSGSIDSSEQEVIISSCRILTGLSSWETLKNNAKLTDRESEIIALIADGLSNKEIAVQLGVGVRTIETHRERLMQKLDIHRIAGLTKFAIASGLVSLEK